MQRRNDSGYQNSNLQSSINTPIITPTMTTPQPTLRPRHLLNLADLSAADIRFLLNLADSYYPLVKNPHHNEKSTDLKNHCIANLFFEDSTRTRISFTRAAQLLSADVVDLTSKGSSTSKGETTIDTALNIEAMGVSALIIRHPSAGAPHQVARLVNIPVINAGDGRHEHPTQGLLDLFTLKTHWQTDDFTGKTITIVGDIKNSRVARSNIHGLQKLGAKVILTGPPTLVPKSPFENLGAQVTHNFDETLPCSDALIMLRIQFERFTNSSIISREDYRLGYALTKDRERKLKPHTLIMHPGPMNRGLEINSEPADGENSIILHQVTHGVALRMAVLRSLIL